jgi:hypothetical protein
MDNSNLNYKMYKGEEVLKKHYVIEGDDETEGQSCENDFFNKLKCMTQNKCVGDDSNHDTHSDDTDKFCLLTKEALDDIHVTLNCGHKFNYIPLYKEVVIQKTSAGMTTNGYYNSLTLRLNEMKCPYCRRVQDKLLPFLKYDNIKRLRGVNGPESLCMKARMCEHVETPKRKNTKKKISDSCECNATHVVNGAHYCKKHYEQQQQEKEQQQQGQKQQGQLQQGQQQEEQQEKKEETSSSSSFESENANMCGVIIKTGKKKGLPCTSSSKCRIHAHLRKNVIVVATCVD